MSDDNTGIGTMVRTIRRRLARAVNRPGSVGYGVGVAVSLALFGLFGTIGILADGLHFSRVLAWWYGVSVPPVRDQLAYFASVCGACGIGFGALAFGLYRADNHTSGGEVTQ